MKKLLIVLTTFIAFGMVIIYLVNKNRLVKDCKMTSPNLIGLPHNELEELTKAWGITIIKKDTSFESSLQEDIVVTQNPLLNTLYCDTVIVTVLTKYN